MNPFIRIGLFLILSIVFIGCIKHDYEDGQLANPVFYCSGKLNGQTLEMYAGQSDLILSSNVRLNELGVLEWSSSFRNHLCAQCPAKLEVTFFNESNPSVDSVTEPFALGLVRYAKQTTQERLRSFHLHSYGMPEGFSQWNFGDGSIANGHEVNHTYAVNGQYDVNLTISAFGAVEAVIEQTVQAGSNETLAMPFGVEVLSSELARAVIPANLELAQLNPLYWSINGVNIGLIPELEFHPGDEIRLEYQHLSTGRIGHYSIRSEHFNTTDLGVLEVHRNLDWLHGTRVRVSYTDELGTRFHSCVEENDQQHFEVLGIQDGSDDWFAGSPCNLITLRFSGWLVSEANPNHQIYMEEITGEFGYILEQ